MKKVIVLAGGYPQISLITKLQKKGFYVILIDNNLNPVAKKYCDKYYRESTLDVETVKNITKSEGAVAILTVCTDQALLTVAKVSEDLGLPCYIDYKTALNVTNKKYMKDVFVKNKIPTSKHVILEDFKKTYVKGLKFPLIVKPVDCNSSKGVKKVDNFDELIVAFDQAKRLSRTNNVVIEEYIDGVELSVDVFVQDGIAHVLSISNSEKIKKGKGFVIFRTVAPAFPNIKKKIELIAQKIANSFGIKNSPMLIQLLAKDNKPFVIEFSARTGGGLKYIFIKHQSGFDVIESVIDLTFGKKPLLSLRSPETKFYTNEFIYCKNGIYKSTSGFDVLKQNGIIKDYYLFKESGASFSSISNSGDRIAGFTIVDNNLDSFLEKHKIARCGFQILDEKGKDIARHDLLVNFTKKQFK